MTPELKEFLEFNPKDQKDGYEVQAKLRKKVDPELLYRYSRAEIDSYFIPEKFRQEKKKLLSPDEKYQIIINSYETREGCWYYSQGIVYRVGSDEPIATINRNYSSFPYLFIEDHPNGHDYLVCGQDYQGQTVIELDTGKRKDLKPHEKGFGFCWSSYEFDYDSKILVVNGCFWACPYEYNFYDFSDPMNGWPELVKDELVESDTDDGVSPTIKPDGTIITYQIGYGNEKIVATKFFKRSGNSLILEREEITPNEKKRREEEDTREKEFDELVEEYDKNDPIWLRFLELLKDPIFNFSGLRSIGRTFDTWCPTWKGSEYRFCKRINESNGKGYTLDIEIAHLSGPIKLITYHNGKVLEPMLFEHSIDGIEKAISYAKELITSNSK